MSSSYTSIIDRFDQIADQYSDKRAFFSRDYATSYSELAVSSNRVGRALERLNGQGPVILLADRLDWVSASMLGVLRAGRFWVALDPAMPTPRLRQIVEDAGADTFVYDEKHTRVVDSLAGEGASVRSWQQIQAESSERLGVRRAQNDIATITYTSGSTGSPKGVVHTDRELLDHIDAVTAGEGWSLRPDDRRVFLGSPTFGGAVGGLLSSILLGMTLQPFSVTTSNLLELANWIVDEETTVYQSTPALFRQLMQTVSPGTTFPKVRIVRLGGDVVTSRDVALFQSHFDRDCLLLISYSSTECGRIASKTIRGSDEPRGVVSVGRPVQGVTVKIVDESGSEMPDGETGEIIVTGVRGPRRYWNRGTEERRFQTGEDGAATFRTGDLGRFDDRGEIVLIGRVDRQIKVRGHRVEPMEIETALMTHSAVRHAAVIGKRRASDDMELQAFVEVNDKVSAKDLRTHVAELLPDYMVPPLIRTLDHLPLTSANKIDRDALERYEDPRVPARGRGPLGPNERVLLEIWRSVLDSDDLGLNDDFFEYGGDSVLAARAFGEIEQRIGVRLPLSSLFDACTVESQARLLEEGDWGRYYKVLVAMRPTGSRPILFCVAGGGGNVVGFNGLVNALGNDQPVYGLQSPWLADEGMKDAGLEEIAEHYVEAVQSVQPHGPYLFAGYSSGGVYAFEMAQQLLNRGERVAYLAMLDTGYSVDGENLTLSARIHRRITLLLENPLFRISQYAVEYRKRFAAWGTRILRDKLGDRAPDLRTGVRWLPDASRYRAKPFDGRLTLFKSTEVGDYHGGGPVENWAVFARGGADIVPIAGTHTTMLQEPAVRHLAAEMIRLIDLGLERERVHDDVAEAVS